MGPSPSEGLEPERRNSQESSGGYWRPAEQQHQPSHHVQPTNPVFQQQQPPSQSYGYKEPAAPASTQRSVPSAGGGEYSPEQPPSTSPLLPTPGGVSL
ncbi:LIM and SH3 domain protein 1-like [Neopelma chrysocephalum]|uniref:LIM and SH3 domain protein 1-like n=1 Tax=Neopelma chrysocephalum TaxID=114329 RepID=UPI000FCD0CC0|nr:LIM and SH3 domain protein 1-like [Neopelma chrysocephalum]